DHESGSRDQGEPQGPGGRRPPLRLPPVQPRVPPSLRSSLLGRQRDTEGVPAELRPAPRAHAGRRSDRRRVQLGLPARGIPDARGAGVLGPAARGQVHDRDPLRRAHVRGGLRAVVRRSPPSRMRTPSSRGLAAAWRRHEAAWRDPVEVLGHWGEYQEVDPRLLAATTKGAFWDVLAETGATLVVTREYEHLVLALRSAGRVRETSYLRLPHPSGLAVDPARKRVHVALTRNPNQIAELRPVEGLLKRT